MYHDYFNFHTDPFPLSPSLRFLFHSRVFEETMAHIVYGLKHGEDITLITGAIGTGKTLALHQLLSLTESSYRQAFVNVTQVDYLELLKLIARDLGLDTSRAVDRADLLLALRDEFRLSARQGQKILLVVDEAQNLDLVTLEGLRMLGNLGLPGEPVLRIVLSGQLGLEQKLERPELAQLRQRIRVHYRLEVLTRSEVEQYIQHRLRVAGGAENLFTSGAVERIHDLSGGVPRLVNHLAAKGLLSAFVADAKRVEARHVEAEGTPAPPAPVPPSQDRAAGSGPEAATPRAAPVRARPVSPRARAGAAQPLSVRAPEAEASVAPSPRVLAEPPVRPPAGAGTKPAPDHPAQTAANASRERLDELLPPLSWRRRQGRWTLLYVTIIVLLALVLAVLIGPSLGDLTRSLGVISVSR